jgi:hypothetical protein
VPHYFVLTQWFYQQEQKQATTADGKEGGKKQVVSNLTLRAARNGLFT